MLKKIIKTHTARLDYVDITKPTFLRNAVATNRQRRVIASVFQNGVNLLSKWLTIFCPKAQNLNSSDHMILFKFRQHVIQILIK